MIKLLKNLKLKEWFFMFICVGLIVMQVWLDLKLAGYTIEISTMLKTKGTTSAMIWEKGAFMLLCAIGTTIFAIFTNFLSSKIGANFSMRLRGTIFNKIESFSIEQIKNFSTASLITRTTNDVMQVQSVLTMGLQVLIKAPIMAIWAICEMSKFNWQCSIATAVAVTVMLTTIFIAVGLSMPKFKMMQKLTDGVNKVTRENLEGVRVVRAYNAESFENAKFEKANNQLTKTSLFTGRVMSIMGPMMTFVMSSLTLAIYWIGAVLIRNANLVSRADVFGEVMGFSSFATRVVMSFMMITLIFLILPRASVSAKRINQILNSENKITDGLFNSQTETQGVIEFKNVFFKYPDAEDCILENISFSVNKGESVAFIGSTGSGKSTLINLIPRFYDISDGEILVDGVNIKDYNLKTLRNKIGYISQKAIMFSGTVKSNLLLGECDVNPSDEDLNKALEISCGLDFVNNMPDQKDSFISQGGTNISGGQKQRLSIARAIARKPEILIFDDSFSALDYKTDKILRKNLNQNLTDVTRLIVAQRIGTIKDCDKIIVLDEGKIVGQGKHEELLKTCTVYKEIALSQLSKEELDNETSRQ